MSSSGSPRAAPAAAPPATTSSSAEEELLLLPDVIERLPKPDKAAHDAAVAKLDAEIKSLQNRSAAIRSEMDALKGGRGGFGEQIQAAKAVFAQLRAHKDSLIQQRNHLTAKVKTTLDKKDATIKSQKSLRQNLRFQSEEEFDREISSLRHQQETRSMTLNEEKRLVKEIEALQLQKLQVAKIPDDKSELDKANDTIKDIKAQQAKKNAEIDAVQEQLTEQKLKLDELYKRNEDEKKQDKFPALAKERKDIKEALDEKFTALKALRSEFKLANDKYFENIRLVRKKKELERKKEDERRRLEYEAKLADYEKEMAKIHPYQDEMDLCDALVAFLEKHYAKELKEEADNNAAEEDKKSSSTTPATLDGLKPLQRKDEDFMSFGGGSKKAKKAAAAGTKKDTKKSKRDAKLSLPIAQLDAFSSVGLVPPSTVAALSGSIAAIKEKKTWFNAQTTRPKPATAAAAAEPEKKAAETPASPTSSSSAAAAAPPKSPKKKANKKFNAADKHSFPTLGASPKNASAPVAWGPGMAPPPAPVSYFGGDAVVADEDAE